MASVASACPPGWQSASGTHCSLRSAELAWWRFYDSFGVSLGIEHAVAGLLYTFSPVTVVFLVPSSLFLGYAARAVARRCVRERCSRRPAPSLGSSFRAHRVRCGQRQLPGFPRPCVSGDRDIPTALYLVVVERSSKWLRVFVWCASAAALSLIVAAAAIVTSYYGSTTLSENLAKTETLEAISEEFPRGPSPGEEWGSGLRTHHRGFHKPTGIGPRR